MAMVIKYYIQIDLKPPPPPHTGSSLWVEVAEYSYLCLLSNLLGRQDRKIIVQNQSGQKKLVKPYLRKQGGTYL
jgi:hypothetical protein